MRDTRSLIDTQRHQTNKSQLSSNYHTQQPHSDTDINNLNNHHSNMNNDQNGRYFRVEGQLRYKWSADQEIMTNINRRDKSPETSELVTRRIELAKPGAMRFHWNKNLGREIIHTTETWRKQEERDKTNRPPTKEERKRRPHRWRIFHKLRRRNAPKNNTGPDEQRRNPPRKRNS